MNTKLIVALVIVGVLAVTFVGIVAAQAAFSSPAPNGKTTNGAPVGGFFGWMGRMMGFRGTQYYSTQATTNQEQPITVTVTNPNTNTTTTYQVPPGYGTSLYPSQPENITVANPNTGTTTTYQGYPEYGGCGMMRGFYP